MSATTTTAPVPDWLVQRAGTLAPGVMPGTHVVMVGGRPLYRLDVRPVKGKFACAVANAVNGHRLEDPTATYASVDAALAGGLEQLRDRLGW